jgi:hypothetical protein
VADERCRDRIMGSTRDQTMPATPVRAIRRNLQLCYIRGDRFSGSSSGEYSLYEGAVCRNGGLGGRVLADFSGRLVCDRYARSREGRFVHGCEQHA